MKLAFLISAFTDAPHLRRFVDALPEDADVFVHIDAGVDETPFREVLCGTRAQFIENRVRVMWGSFRQVEFQMELIRAALSANIKKSANSQQPNTYDYLFMLSGQDYPVWSPRRIVQYLEEHQGENFLQAMSLVGRPEADTREYTRYRFLNNYPWRYGTWKSRFRVALRHLCELFLKKPLAFDADGRHWQLYKGSDYFALTGELAQYVLGVYDNSPQLRRYFRNSFAPSETFVHTIAFNTPEFAEKCILSNPPKDGRVPLEELTPLTYIEYGEKIRELTAEDFPKIKASGKMFCRKCVTGVSDSLLALIAEEQTEQD
ncbi:MAG: conjugal transfer protein [Prevotella sp.]|nr:conjugal transfer protein [Prevotella sp.]